jgi:hypothetical protein
LLRVLRLNCLTAAYSELWRDLFDEVSFADEDWAVPGSGLAPLGAGLTATWAPDSALRSEYARRLALVEIDALVAVMLGMSAEELVAVLRSRYPIVTERESRMWFDAEGRRIAGNANAFGQGQTKEQYLHLLAHLAEPEQNPLPHGYTGPVRRPDREAEYRVAHARFVKRVRA